MGLKYLNIEDDSSKEISKVKTGIEEFDSIFSGWLPKKSFTVVTWAPWVWKSTMMMMLAASLNLKTHYFSAEEGPLQISDREKRMKHLNLDKISILFTKDTDKLLQMIDNTPDLECVVIDSLQTFQSSKKEWLNSQMQYLLEELRSRIDSRNLICLAIWQITKSWELAWPNTILHFIDIKLHFQNNNSSWVRKLITEKNRFWMTWWEIPFKMTLDGKLTPISKFEMYEEFRKTCHVEQPWSVITGIFREDRIHFVNVQTIVRKRRKGKEDKDSSSNSIDTNDKNVTISGSDTQRFKILDVILQRRSNLRVKLNDYQYYINIVNPDKIALTREELDLGIMMSILSALTTIPLRKRIVYGSVWLMWEIYKPAGSEGSWNKFKSMGFDSVLMDTCDSLEDLEIGFYNRLFTLENLINHEMRKSLERDGGMIEGFNDHVNNFIPKLKN